MKAIDLVLLLILAIPVYFVVRSLLKEKKHGGCAYCSQRDKCSSVQPVQLQTSMKTSEDQDKLS